jgi:hypothetical protein
MQPKTFLCSPLHFSIRLHISDDDDHDENEAHKNSVSLS